MFALRWAIVVLFTLLAVPAQAQQDWPTKPVRWIVPYAAGGFADTSVRKLTAELTKVLKQSVVVENRAGAGGVVGTEMIAKAAPDGYTFGSGNLAPLAVNPSLMQQLPYDVARDIAPILLIETAPLILTVGPSLPAKTVRDVVAMAKERPGKLTFGSSGIGGAHHLSGEMLCQQAGVKMVHVPYKGGAPAATDLLGGHLSIMFEMGYAALPSIQSGKVRALAVTSSKRLAILPDVPTMAEAGFPGFESFNWQGVVGPAKMPRPIIERLNRELNGILQIPQIRESIVSLGSEIAGGTPEDFGRFIQAEMEKWAKVIREGNIKAE